MLKLKTVCLFVLGYGLLLISLNAFAILGVSFTAYTFLVFFSMYLPQFVIASMVYIPFFWKQYKLKTLLPLLLTILICLLYPLSLSATSHLRRLSLAARIDSYTLAVQQIQNTYSQAITTGENFLLDTSDYNHLGEKVAVMPKMYGAFAVAFKQPHDWLESTLLFVDHEEGFDWQKIQPMLGTHKQLAPHWYAMYKKNPPTAKQAFRPSIEIRQPYCPYRRN